MIIVIMTRCASGRASTLAAILMPEILVKHPNESSLFSERCQEYRRLKKERKECEKTINELLERRKLLFGKRYQSCSIQHLNEISDRQAEIKNG